MRRHRSVLFAVAMLVFSLGAMSLVTVSAQRAPRDADTLASEGVIALQEKRFGDALESFTQAAKILPRQPEVWLGAGIAAFMLGQNDDAEASLNTALALNPRLSEASYVLGELQYRTGRIREAIATYEGVQHQGPGHRDFTEKLAEWKKDAAMSDRFYESRGAHFRVLFEGPADEALARRAVEMLEAAYWRVGRALTTYPSQAIDVVLYTQHQFRDVTQAPDWSGGAYDGRIRVPVRDALDEPEELERVLAHEFVHAVVVTLGGRTVPVWLNEGLATVFEPGGLEHSKRVLEGAGARPPLRALQGSFRGLSRDGATIAYAQSAVAAAHMLDLRGASATVALLQDLARGIPFETAFHQRIAMSYGDFERLVMR